MEPYPIFLNFESLNDGARSQLVPKVLVIVKGGPNEQASCDNLNTYIWFKEYFFHPSHHLGPLEF
jgi:hypothetical protein